MNLLSSFAMWNVSEEVFLAFPIHPVLSEQWRAADLGWK
jgi:hypothetical protein